MGAKGGAARLESMRLLITATPCTADFKRTKVKRALKSTSVLSTTYLARTTSWPFVHLMVLVKVPV